MFKYIQNSILDFGRQIAQLIGAVWVYFPAFLIICVVMFLCFYVHQMQDVLLLSTEEVHSSVFMYFAILFWIIVTWYASRIITYFKFPNRWETPFWYFHLPRMMGYGCFIVIELAFFHLPVMPYYYNAQMGTNFFVLNNINIAIFIIHILIYLKFHRIKSFNWFPWWAALGLPISGAGLAIYKEYPYVFWKILGIASIYFVTGLAFLRFVTYRNLTSKYRYAALDDQLERLPKKRWFYRISKYLLHQSEQGLQRLGPDVVQKEKYFFLLFNIIMLIGSSLYLAVILDIQAARFIGSYAFVFLACGVLAGLGMLITLINVASGIAINWHFLLLFGVYALGFLEDPYKVRIWESGSGHDIYEHRQGLEEYFRRWCLSRAQEIKVYNDAGKPYPLYFVLSEGGASRSAYWVGSTLGSLQDENPNFSKHLFCLSSASGGTLGNMAFFALLYLKNYYDYDFKSHKDRLQEYMTNDFLTFMIGRALGPDFFRHLLPFRLMNDRAAALERSMEEVTKGAIIGDVFEKKMAAFMTHRYDDYSLPIFFINTTRMQDAGPGVISNIDVESKHYPGRIDVLDLLSISAKNATQHLRMSTSIVLSSRFPFVSPAGNIKNNYFVDGGYLDNSGAGMAHETMMALDRMLKNTEDRSLSQWKGKIAFYVIHIINSSLDGEPLEPIHPMVNDLAAPLKTLAGSFLRQTDLNNERVRTYLKDKYEDDKHWFRVSLYKGSSVKEAPYSMNWVISDRCLRRMDARFKELKGSFIKDKAFISPIMRILEPLEKGLVKNKP